MVPDGMSLPLRSDPFASSLRRDRAFPNHFFRCHAFSGVFALPSLFQRLSVSERVGFSYSVFPLKTVDLSSKIWLSVSSWRLFSSMPGARTMFSPSEALDPPYDASIPSHGAVIFFDAMSLTDPFSLIDWSSPASQIPLALIEEESFLHPGQFSAPFRSF